MRNQVVQFSGLSERDREYGSPLPDMAEGDRLELRVRHKNGNERNFPLPPAAVNLVENLLARLFNGERVALLTQDQELSPTEASEILGLSRPLVVHRMDIGDLPFRYVGKHRRIAAPCSTPSIYATS